MHNMTYADVSNYRPISLLCSVSKVLERLIFNHVSDHIYPYLSTYQFGFIPDRSCLQQLLSTFSIILQNYSSHKQTDIVYLDFCKAFDSIPHTELLYKINQLGISGNVLEWFQSYLSCRRQSVLIDGIHSSMLPVTSAWSAPGQHPRPSFVCHLYKRSPKFHPLINTSSIR